MIEHLDASAVKECYRPSLLHGVNENDSRRVWNGKIVSNMKGIAVANFKRIYHLIFKEHTWLSNKQINHYLKERTEYLNSNVARYYYGVLDRNAPLSMSESSSKDPEEARQFYINHYNQMIDIYDHVISLSDDGSNPFETVTRDTISNLKKIQLEAANKTPSEKQQSEAT